jgi:hypothetical protein
MHNNKKSQTPAKESSGLYELEHHKPRVDKECLRFLDQRKKAKMQWVRDPSQSNIDNLKNVILEVSRHFSNKKKDYLKSNIEELETNSNIKNI